MSKTIAAILIIIVICVSFTGCFDSREIDDLAYVIALGLDKGVSNTLKLTIQYAVPKSTVSGGDSGDGRGGGKNLDIMTLEAPSLYSALNLANNSLSREINLSHAVVIVFSEELAREGGVGKYIRGMVKGLQFRPNMYIAISRGSAEDYLKEIKPVLEVDPSKYYELNYRSYRYTGFFADSSFHRFYTHLESNSIQPVAILAGVGIYTSSKEFSNTRSTYKEKGKPRPFEGDYKAGDIPKVADVKSEVMGLAVFDGYKMVGELDGEEASDYLMVTGEYRTANTTITDPEQNDKVVILSTKQSRKPVMKVDIIDGKPVISIKISLEGDITAIQSGINYESAELAPMLEKKAQDHFEKDITRFLNKTAQEFHSDICGFGRIVKGRFLTRKEWDDFKWLQKYKNSTFNVSVDYRIRRPGITLRSSPIESSEGVE